MQLKPLALAAAAAAFAVIPELSESDEKMFKALPIHNEPSVLPIPLESRFVSLPCEQCNGKGSSVQLNFDVVDQTRLLLNGFEVYPHYSPWPADLEATVASVDGESTEQKLGYSIAIAPVVADEDAHMELFDLELRVFQVGARFVDDVPMVNVKLLKAPANEIAIVDVKLTSPGLSGCESMACHAKALVEDAFKALKGMRPLKSCHGWRKGKGHHKSYPSMANGIDDVPPPHHHHHHHDGHHHRHHRHQPWGRFITNIAAQIFLPVLIGITAGVGVALFAMALCNLFLRVLSFFRGGHDDQATMSLHKSEYAYVYEAVAVGEKADLRSETDDFPYQYDETTKS